MTLSRNEKVNFQTMLFSELHETQDQAYITTPTSESHIKEFLILNKNINLK